MKRIWFISMFLMTSTLIVKAQSANDVLNVLIENGTLKQEQADSLRADAAIKQQDADAKKKIFQVTSTKALKISGYGDFRYQIQQEKGKSDGFDVRRAYLDVKGDITPYWNYRLQTDFAGTPKIVDVYTEFKINDKLNFTIGQQILPFSLNNVTSNTKLELADRSQVVEALSSRKGDVLGDNNGRDIGISVYGSFLPVRKLNLIEYRIGVFNGSGINKSDLNDDKDVVGRVLLHPVNGLDIGGSYYIGYTPDSTTLNNKTVSTQLGLRKRIGGEICYTYKFLNFKAEYLIGKDGLVEKSGYYGQLTAFVIPDKLQVAGRYDVYDKNTDKDDNITTNITLGTNFFINKNALLQVAYTLRQEEGTSFDNDLVALQLQISF